MRQYIKTVYDKMQYISFDVRGCNKGVWCYEAEMEALNLSSELVTLTCQRKIMLNVH